jgi:hypothetical protein
MAMRYAGRGAAGMDGKVITDGQRQEAAMRRQRR